MHNRAIIWVFMVMTALLLLPVTAFAADADMAKKDELTDDDIGALDEYYDVKPVSCPPENGYISGFEVADDGRIAVSYSEHAFFSTETNSNKCICVFDQNGGFLYGYSFRCGGDAYAGWINSNASIFNVRASCIIEVSNECDIIGRYEYPVSDAAAVQNISGKTYCAQVITPLFSRDYASITVSQEDGAERTVISIGERAQRHNRIFYLFSGLLDIVILVGAPAAILAGTLVFVKKRRAGREPRHD